MAHQEKDSHPGVGWTPDPELWPRQSCSRLPCPRLPGLRLLQGVCVVLGGDKYVRLSLSVCGSCNLCFFLPLLKGLQHTWSTARSPRDGRVSSWQIDLGGSQWSPPRRNALQDRAGTQQALLKGHSELTREVVTSLACDPGFLLAPGHSPNSPTAQDPSGPSGSGERPRRARTRGRRPPIALLALQLPRVGQRPVTCC